ncbi:hypothetical protein Q7C36_019724 [Tachysurus vachellii]|uniref:Uncharacterized protein n=1 Tax=Tachysurus vachellii TaxID=175792 RepID=A0AA88LSB3_TACVA|nr:hypothetical protein Q7C36_019724 [Tachysurus vachellii]
MNLFRVGRVGCFAWTAVSLSSELHAVICHWLPVFSLLHTTAHMSKRSIYLHAPAAPKQPQPQQAIKVCLHYTLVKLLLWGPVALPSGRKETNEMEVMRCSMLGSEWKAQFVAGERTYGTGNWPAVSLQARKETEERKGGERARERGKGKLMMKKKGKGSEEGQGKG